jgi:tetratricopeptide (TPR) repeat protein
VTDPLGRLIAHGERAAFHGSPVAAIEPLTAARDSARNAGRADETAAAGWLLGVALGAAGRYGQALAELEPLTAGEPDSPAATRLFAGLAEATVGSLLRQLGRHDDAALRDARALALAGAEPLDPVAFDAHLGLAADAVGGGDAEAATDGLTIAEAILEQHPEWWRQRVRHGWVVAEVALLRERPDVAVSATTASLAIAEESGAPRHVAKSLLFLGVALLQTGAADAVDHLRRAASLAESLGAAPLIWPTRALLSALIADDPAATEASLLSARATVMAIADDLPEPLRTDWLARPDIAALAGT